MGVKVKRTQEDKQKKFKQQLNFLKSSCRAYDHGDLSEAIRISNALMMLLYHDGKNNHSLMEQAQIPFPPFTDTRKPSNSTETVKAGDAALTHVDMSKGQYVPLYYDNPRPNYQIFDDWWDAPVLFTPDHSVKLSRKEVVKYMRDQDGGGHSDPTLDEKYSKFSLENGVKVMVGKPDKDVDINAPHNPDDWMEVTHAELATVRQIAHEFLDTIREQIDLRVEPRFVMPFTIKVEGKPV